MRDPMYEHYILGLHVYIIGHIRAYIHHSNKFLHPTPSP